MARRVSLVVTALILLVTVGPAHAGLVSVTLGTQDFFTDGQVVGSATFSAAAAGEPVPFDQIYGADSAAGPDFSKAWTFNFSAGLTVLSASLTLGIWDNDSAAPGSQVNSFTLDATNNLTTVLDTAFEVSPGASNQIKIYTIVIPPTALGAFDDGSATFSLTLQNAVNVLNQTVHNGAGLDFSTLDLTTVDNQVATPEPSTWLLLASGLGGLAGYRRGRRK
jgi:hypothetical protein